MTRIAVVGGHGKVARHLHPERVKAGYTPVAVVHNESHHSDLERLGGEVGLLDIEREDASAFAAALDSRAATRWSARPAAAPTATSSGSGRWTSRAH